MTKMKRREELEKILFDPNGLTTNKQKLDQLEAYIDKEVGKERKKRQKKVGKLKREWYQKGFNDSETKWRDAVRTTGDDS